MHDMIDQDSLLMKSLLPLDGSLVIHDIAALVAYSHNNKKTIQSMMKSIDYLTKSTDYLTCQIKTLEHQLGTFPTLPPSKDCKPIPKGSGTCKPSATSLPSTKQNPNNPSWKGQTPLAIPNETCKWKDQTWYYCTKCLNHSSWVANHCTKPHTPAFGKAELACLNKKKESCNLK